MREILSNVHAILQDNLAGMYLYGSLAMACFRPASSDIDLILVTRETLEKGKRKKIVEYLQRTGSRDRRIELSIIDMATLQNPRYPMTVDLHYEYWGNTFENKKDREILSNLYTTAKRGFRVWGAPIDEVFSKVPAEYHLRSVVEDIQHTRKHLHDNPETAGYNVAVYWILSSSRILAFIREKKVLSKLEGGQWGLANLPKEHHKLIQQAIDYYRGERKNGIFNPKEVDVFAEYMTHAILMESKEKGI